MKRKELLNEVIGAFRIRLESIEADHGIHDYGIPSQAWRRGAKFMQHFGIEQALDVIDQRAQRAADRGNYNGARRWRDLITAIHAIQEDEQLPGDKKH